MKQFKLPIVTVVAVAVFLVGCAGFVNNANKTLYGATMLSDGAMKSYATWWKDKTNHVGVNINDMLTQRSNVMAISVKVGKSIETAQMAVDSYAANVGTNTTTKAIVNALIETAIQNAGNFASELSLLTTNAP